MNIKLLFKLWAASLCAVFACYLPQSLAKPHEIAVVRVSHVEAVQAISMGNVQTLAYLSQTPDEAAAKAYIYAHESSNNPSSVNSIGCRGLGQACPGSKLPCGADYACQDAWFSNYARDRYGSWTQAKAAWLSQYDATGNHYW